MNLYEIEQSILDCVDEETGEIIDIERLEALEMEREKKIDGVALYCKNLAADVEALKAEKAAFDARMNVAKNKLESMKKWLCNALGEQKYTSKDQKVAVSFRHNKSVDVVDLNALIDFDIAGDYIKYTTEAKKTEIKKAIDSGIEIPGCTIVESTSTIIK